MNIFLQLEANPVQMRLLYFYPAVLVNLKLDHWLNHEEFKRKSHMHSPVLRARCLEFLCLNFQGIVLRVMFRFLLC